MSKQTYFTYLYGWVNFTEGMNRSCHKEFYYEKEECVLSGIAGNGAYVQQLLYTAQI